MKNITKFIGLDVSKEKIAVAVADEGRSEPRFIGMIPHTVESIRNLVHRLADSLVYYSARQFDRLDLVDTSLFYRADYLFLHEIRTFLSGTLSFNFWRLLHS